MSSAIIHTCSACDRIISFRSDKTNYITCPHCSARYALENGLLRLEIMKELAKDSYSRIKIGTKGVYDSRKFDIIGRSKYYYEEMYANCWMMLFADGTILELEECMGFYAVKQEVEVTDAIEKSVLDKIGFDGKKVKLLGDNNFILERKYRCEKKEYEGETQMINSNEKFSSYSFASEKGERIEIISGRNLLRYYLISYCGFNNLNMEGLRDVGWDTHFKRINCGSCNTENELHSYPFTQSFSCKKCGAHNVIQNDHVTSTDGADKHEDLNIPLLAKGKLKGVECKVVGYQKKMDQHSYVWKEYTLFSPDKGYAFLSEYEGNWIYLEERIDAPVLLNTSTSEFEYERESYFLYNSYRYRIVDSVGEFPANTFDNKGPSVQEYISPPEMWIRERESTNGLTWFKGEHISWLDIKKAFDNQGMVMPLKKSFGAIQPVWGYVNPALLWNTMLVLVGVFLIAQIVSNSLNEERVLYSNTIQLPDSANISPVVTEKFELTKPSSNVQIKIAAPVSNSWFEVNVALVNAENGKEYSIQKGVEYYSGYDSEGSWTEGSRSDDVILSSIPRGKYFMQIYPFRESSIAVNYFEITVINDVPVWRNFFVFTIMMLIFPLLWWFYMKQYEKMRWSNSPYSPYNNDDDEE